MSINLFLEQPALLKIIFFLDILLKISDDFFTEHLLVNKFVVIVNWLCSLFMIIQDYVSNKINNLKAFSFLNMCFCKLCSSLQQVPS